MVRASIHYAARLYAHRAGDLIATTDATALETLPAPTSRIAGFWRRVGALVLDSIVLGLLGIPLGLLVGERFAPVGTPARLMGLLVLIPYLGLLGSQVGRGQTLGKRLLGLRVVDASGQPLSVTRACMRAALLSLPWAFNGLHFRTLGRSSARRSRSQASSSSGSVERSSGPTS